MKKKKTPSTKPEITRSIEAIQVAFELRPGIPDFIRVTAAQNGLSPSAQIRNIIGLPYQKAKRPRLTVSLSNDDYLALGKRYNIMPDENNELESWQRLGIRQKIEQELLDFYTQESGK